MPGIRIKVEGQVENLLIPDLPYARRIEFAEAVAFKLSFASSASYQTVGLAQMGTLQSFILIPDQDITVRLANQSDGGVVVKADGIFALFDGTISNAADVGLKILFNAGGSVTITVLAAGS